MATGFEQKELDVVILNWLWHPEPGVRCGAGMEVRKRFIQTHPEPDWVKQLKQQYTGDEVV
jgi:hypothetical protein